MFMVVLWVNGTNNLSKKNNVFAIFDQILILSLSYFQPLLSNQLTSLWYALTFFIIQYIPIVQSELKLFSYYKYCWTLKMLSEVQWNE